MKKARDARGRFVRKTAAPIVVAVPPLRRMVEIPTDGSRVLRCTDMERAERIAIAVRDSRVVQPSWLAQHGETLKIYAAAMGFVAVFAVLWFVVRGVNL